MDSWADGITEIRTATVVTEPWPYSLSFSHYLHYILYKPTHTHTHLQSQSLSISLWIVNIFSQHCSPVETGMAASSPTVDGIMSKCVSQWCFELQIHQSKVHAQAFQRAHKQLLTRMVFSFSVLWAERSQVDRKQSSSQESTINKPDLYAVDFKVPSVGGE